MDEAFHQRLLATFKAEAQEHLDGISAGLQSLAQPGAGGKQKLEIIFRHAHSLKGAARSVGAGQIARLCQALENVFAALRTGPLQVSPELLQRLFEVVDGLSDLLENQDAHGAQRLQDWERALARWTAVPGEITPGARPPAAAAGTAEEALPTTSTQMEAAPASPHMPVPPTGPRAAPVDTVRVPTARLDSLLFQAEEMLAARLAGAERLVELEQLQQRLAAWRLEWGKVRNVTEGWAEADPGARHAADDQAARAVKGFLAWNAEFMRAFEGELDHVHQNASRDQRLLGTMLDRLLDTTKEALMLPFHSLFEWLPRVVRDLSRELHKDIDLKLEGGAVEVDRRILEELKDPLLHLVRNSMAHGFESPAERVQRGKPPGGVLTVSASQKSGGNIEWVVADDGRGLNLEAIRSRAVGSGLRSPEQSRDLSPEELGALVFESGLSTSSSPSSDLAGRGLGLAIVREKVEKLSGSVSLQSTPGAGVRVTMILPATLARFRGVLVRAADRLFIVPSAPLRRVARVAPDELQTVENRETIRLEGQVLPLVRIAELLELAPGQPVPRRPALAEPTRRANGHSAAASAARTAGTPHLAVFVAGRARNRIAFAVDEILAEQEVLMKGLGKQLRRVTHIAGATVLGDGRVVPILNVDDLLNSAVRVRSPVQAPAKTAAETAPKAILVAEDSITSRMFLKAVLQRAGYHVDTAADGAAAFSALQKQHFDLLVSDVDMPRLNGVELTAKIRRTPALAELPVVLVTALGSTQDQARGLQAGANAYVVKTNFEQSNLLAVVSRLLP